MEEQVHPEKIQEVATTVAGVVLKQKMSDTNPLGRDCKLEFVSAENFKHQVSTVQKDSRLKIFTTNKDW